MKHLHPRAVTLFFVQNILKVLFILGFTLAFILGAINLSYFEDAMGMFYVILIFLTLIISYVWARLMHHFYLYELSDTGFRKESGVIWKRYVSIPYDRIQNVDIYRGVWARILGLSDLHIQTAGTAGFSSGLGGKKAPEGQLPGLSMEDAETLRDELMKRTQQSRGSNPGV